MPAAVQPLQSCVYEGQVFHQRFRPKRHKLQYRVCSFLFDLDELPQLPQQLRGFSLNRFNLFSFWFKDHGKGDGSNLREYVDATLAQAGIDTGDELSNRWHIKLLCYPRILGYVFNPLSVYYCYDSHSVLRAIIYEVNNTFGQRHSYVIAVDQPASADAEHVVEQQCAKRFYVSPFIEMDCDYHFTLQPPAGQIGVGIRQTDSDGTLLTADFSGQRTALTRYALLRLMLRYPLMTIKVMAAIHWEALHLWRKGIKLVQRPAPPADSVTVVNPPARASQSTSTSFPHPASPMENLS